MGFFKKLFTGLIGLAAVVVGTVTGQAWLTAIGVTMVSSLLAPTLADAALTFQNSSINTQNAVRVIYGKAKVGLSMVAFPVRDKGGGAPNELMYATGVVCHGSRNGDGIEAFHEMELDGIHAVDDGAADLAGGYWLVSASLPIASFFKDAFQYARYKGSATQAVSAVLSYHFPTEFLTTSRFAGLAYVIGRYESDEGVFRSLPKMTVVVSGAKVYDPRTSTWAWSDNPALCMLDQLLSPVYGRGLAESKIIMASFIAAADYCDTIVTDPDGTRKRYTCNGPLDTQLSLEMRFQQILSSCNGLLIKQEDQYRILIAQPVASSGFTLNERDIVGPVRWKQKGPAESGNSAHISYVDPNQKYTVDVVQWPQTGSADEQTLLNEDNSEPVSIAMDLPFTNNQYMAMRIGAERIKEARSGDVLVITVLEQYAELQIGDRLTVEHGLLGSDSPMESVVRQMVFGADGDGRALVQVVLQKYDATAYTPPTMTAIAAPPPISPPDPSSVSDPTGLSVTAALGAPGEIILTPAWTAPTTGTVSRYEAQYGEGATPTTWIPASDIAKGQTSGTIRIQNPNVTTYSVRIRTINFFGAPGAWVSASVMLTATTTPQSFSYLDKGSVTGAVDIDWSKGWIQKITLTGNVTLTFSGYAAGMALQLFIEQDATGGRTVAFPAVEWTQGAAPTQSSSANDEDSYSFSAEGTTIATVRGQRVALQYAT